MNLENKIQKKENNVKNNVNSMIKYNKIKANGFGFQNLKIKIILCKISYFEFLSFGIQIHLP